MASIATRAASGNAKRNPRATARRAKIAATTKGGSSEGCSDGRTTTIASGATDNSTNAATRTRSNATATRDGIARSPTTNAANGIDATMTRRSASGETFRRNATGRTTAHGMANALRQWPRRSDRPPVGCPQRSSTIATRRSWTETWRFLPRVPTELAALGFGPIPPWPGVSAHLATSATSATGVP
jgi:hypothetical protein